MSNKTNENYNPKDINQNLGSFGDHVKIVSPKEQTKKIKLEPTQETPEGINFEKFTKTKKKKYLPKMAKSKFGIKVEVLLNNKQSLLVIWLTEIISYLFMLGFCAYFLYQAYNVLWPTVGSSSIMNLDENLQKVYAGVVFSYIAIFVPIVPILFLITSWFIEINGVHYSRIFHYVLWTCLSITLLSWIIANGLMWSTLVDFWAFHPFSN